MLNSHLAFMLHASHCSISLGGSDCVAIWQVLKLVIVIFCFICSDNQVKCKNGNLCFLKELCAVNICWQSAQFFCAAFPLAAWLPQCDKTLGSLCAQLVSTVTPSTITGCCCYVIVCAWINQQRNILLMCFMLVGTLWGNSYYVPASGLHAKLS